jgi:homoserine kinase type II
MDKHYGPGNWTRDNVEYDQLRKFGNRGNLRPLSNLPSGIRSPQPRPPSDKVYYSLWHRRTDPEDRDHDMQLGTYSTREKAEEGQALLRDKPGFRDYPDAFEISEGRIDETYETEGFVTVRGDL